MYCPLIPPVVQRLLAVLILCTVFVTASPTQADPPAKKKAAIPLTINFGDGFEKRYTSLTYRDSMTVFDLLVLASKHAHSTKFKHRGQGETAFVSEIDGLTNEGLERNWIFRVNDKLGKRSCGVTRLKPGDTVSWRFETYSAAANRK